LDLAEADMPIYAYRCTECGFQKDHLMKVSDPLLTECPECGKAGYTKMLTAAGFQLKGTGWYVTDFKGSGAKAAPAASTDAKSDEPAKSADTADKADKADSTAKSETAAPAKSESPATPAATSSASASAPAATPSSSSN
jgi:putative FmdB family regulatory protein